MSGIVTFKKDELTIDKLHEHANSLKDALMRWDETTVDITSVKRIDVAAAQVLIAAQKECQTNGKSLTFMTSDTVSIMLTSMGLQL
jgi:ABC-type transporter Mla MlaB component